MYKKISFLLLVLIGLSACNKDKTAGCGMVACTSEYVFAYYGIVFNNANGQPVEVKNVSAINLRTHKQVALPPTPPTVDFVAGFYLVASNENKQEFSTGGDDIEITATSVTTNQTKMATINISGGCNCSVIKKSGPDKLIFD
jgi:hypothetical protein